MTQQDLPMETPVQPNPPKRPRRYDDAVLKAGAQMMLADFKRWLGDDVKHYTDEDLIADLIKACKCKSDAYDRAREMERIGYCPDSDLVDLLDNGCIETAHTEAVKAWVKANNIQPKFQIGDRVDTSMGPGTIIGFYQDEARWVVCVDDPPPVKHEIIRSANYIFDQENLEKVE